VSRRRARNRRRETRRSRDRAAIAMMSRSARVALAPSIRARAARAKRDTRDRASRRAASSDAANRDAETETEAVASERVLRSCLDAVASGDEDALERCLLECEDGFDEHGVSATATIETLRRRPEVKGDAFWTAKLKELSAERVFEDCMTAVMRGDVDEVEACIVDAENDELLRD
jgi:hypothetical protein